MVSKLLKVKKDTLDYEYYKVWENNKCTELSEVIFSAINHLLPVVEISENEFLNSDLNVLV